MAHTAFFARIQGLLSIVDRASDTLATESFIEIQNEAVALSRKQLIELARTHCVFGKPEAVRALGPIIRVELALMDYRDLWRFARHNNSHCLEEMICEELKLRTDLSLNVLLTIAGCFRSADVRDEFKRWLYCEWS